jgi:hypothetical protein
MIFAMHCGDVLHVLKQSGHASVDGPEASSASPDSSALNPLMSSRSLGTRCPPRPRRFGCPRPLAPPVASAALGFAFAREGLLGGTLKTSTTRVGCSANRSKNSLLAVLEGMVQLPMRRVLTASISHAGWVGQW